MNRQTAIILTVITALCCSCFAFMMCVFGGLIASGQPFETTVNGYTDYQTLPAPIGYALLCFSCLSILVPVVVGFLTLRKKPVDAVVDQLPNEPLPPAS